MSFEELCNNYISRIVAFVVTPILLPIATAVAAWLQDAVGIDLSGDQLTAYVVAIAAGLALTAATWLRNRGKWEVAHAELIKLYELGTQAQGTPIAGEPGNFEPNQPTGLRPQD